MVLLFVIHLQRGRKIEYNIDAGDPAGIGFHDLQDGQFHAPKIHLQVPGFDAHGSGHTGAEGGSHEVGGRKPLPFSLIVNGRVGLYFGSGLQVSWQPFAILLRK
jgi:hypothetical protein